MHDPETIETLLRPHGLTVVGGFAPGSEDGTPEGTATLLLVGGDGARLWSVFGASAEYFDGVADPLDRWSRRVLDRVAAELEGGALYPFGGPPWQPFGRWAALGEGSAPSPVRMPVSPLRGLFAGYRGALALPQTVALTDRVAAHPCPDCAQPCRTACPIGAFTSEGYDVPACVAHVGSPQGIACRDGCLVRLACPVGSPPEAAQRRFHMAAFVASQS
jgi:hypothetical protein